MGSDKATITHQRQGLFEQELSYFTELPPEEGSVQGTLDITKNRLKSYLSIMDVVTAHVRDTYVQVVQNFADSAMDTIVGEEIRLALAREKVLADYGRGETDYQCVFLRRHGGGRCLRGNTRMRTYLSPGSGDIVAFFYTTDVTGQELREQLLHQIARLDYEMLTKVDTYHDTYRAISLEHEKEIIVRQKGNFQKAVRELAERYVGEETRKEYLEEPDYTYIKEQLERAPVYLFVMEEHDSQGERRAKWLQLFCVEKAMGIVYITRSDVTDMARKEQRQKEGSTPALVATKQASAAKSDFLSHMSHEIHTPVNAIIGMSTITAQSLGDDEQVVDCIAKIGVLSRFLLSPINDTLDMSRIESGKMLLKNGKIPFGEFPCGINTICYVQAKAEGMDYGCIIAPVVDDYYIGNAMKLQQVLINILSNAIKFTGKNGKVTFSVEQQKRTKNDVILWFVVNDTGVGMSEGFLPHIFEPFFQESAGTTALYRETGLGLAMSKSIVDSTDGRTVVHSIKGVGTGFTMDVKLGTTEEEKLYHRQKKQDYDFSHLKTLMVDDDAAVYKSAMLTLREIGIEAEWTDSGCKAIERVSILLQDGKYFDLILISQRMPEMGGTETARRTRKAVGPGVTVIIVTAYDWASIKHEAKLAGVNLLMSKPMLESALIPASPKTPDEREGQAQQPEVMNYDFSGKQVLLAGDNALNTEMVVILLKNKGSTVETAENGLRAVEIFSKSEKGYYDTILTDIRVSLMSGLTVATSIRHFSNEDAAEIPVVAMTADAFDSDVEKNKAAGMSVHLARPIDPEQMYRALYGLIHRRED